MPKTENKPSRTVYQEKLDHYTRTLADQERRSNRLGFMRLLVFVGGFGVATYLVFAQSFQVSIVVALLTLLVFLVLLSRHEAVKEAIQKTQYLIQINRDSLARTEGKWTKFPDDGREYMDAQHPYSIDLDIFGQASLFQWLNTTNTYFGREAFKRTLTIPCTDADEIRQRQRAMAELASEVDWRQELQALGRPLYEKKRDPEKLLAWMEQVEESNTVKPLVFKVIPAITVLLVLGVLFIPGLNYLWAIIPLLIQAVILRIGLKKMHKIFDTTRRYKEALGAYEGILKLLETTEYASPHLAALRLQLLDQHGRFASPQLKRLSKLVEMSDLRYNAMFYFFINILTLWDYHCFFALQQWKKESGRFLRTWLQTIGEFEALASLALIHYDHPEWTIPELSPEKYVFGSVKMGHPLIADQIRVCNDLQLKGAGNILVITGSNMSGKSTLLRTVGINLVLAYAGAPVCAAKFQCSIMELYSSMRLSDNLEQSISSFYAELLRVKMIIEAAQKHRPMIFLLDEIFRGTNSRDRHMGAKTVLSNLSKEGTMGLVSTHDLELGELEHESGLRIKNYHFNETYENGQIKFDYTLKPGVSTTSNAIYLMKMIGIDVK